MAKQTDDTVLSEERKRRYIWEAGDVAVEGGGQAAGAAPPAAGGPSGLQKAKPRFVRVRPAGIGGAQGALSKAEWDESKHKRDPKSGEFSEGGGGPSAATPGYDAHKGEPKNKDDHEKQFLYHAAKAKKYQNLHNTSQDKDEIEEAGRRSVEHDRIAGEHWHAGFDPETGMPKPAAGARPSRSKEYQEEEERRTGSGDMSSPEAQARDRARPGKPSQLSNRPQYKPAPGTPTGKPIHSQAEADEAFAQYEQGMSKPSAGAEPKGLSREEVADLKSEHAQWEKQDEPDLMADEDIEELEQQRAEEEPAASTKPTEHLTWNVDKSKLEFTPEKEILKPAPSEEQEGLLGRIKYSVKGKEPFFMGGPGHDVRHEIHNIHGGFEVTTPDGKKIKHSTLSELLQHHGLKPGDVQTPGAAKKVMAVASRLRARADELAKADPTGQAPLIAAMLRAAIALEQVSKE